MHQMLSDKEKAALAHLTVEKLMVTDIATVNPQTSLKEAMTLILTKRIRGTPVVDPQKHVLSVITEADLMKLAATHGLDTHISAVLGQLPSATQLVTVKKDQKFVDVYKQFLINPVRRVVVI